MEKFRNIILFLGSIKVINSTVYNELKDHYSIQICPKLSPLNQLPEILILLAPRSESWLTQLKTLLSLF